MAVETYQFLNEAGVQKLATELLGKVNSRIDERIVQAVSETSSTKQTLSAKALYELVAAIKSSGEGEDQGVIDALNARLDTNQGLLDGQAERIVALEGTQATQTEKLDAVEEGLGDLQTEVGNLIHLNIETVTGSMDTVTDPKDDILYFQRDNEADTMWMLYIYQGGSWVNIGDTEVDLSVIWSKEEVEDLKVALNIHNAEALSDDTLVSVANAAYAATAVDLT